MHKYFTSITMHILDFHRHFIHFLWQYWIQELLEIFYCQCIIWNGLVTWLWRCLWDGVRPCMAIFYCQCIIIMIISFTITILRSLILPCICTLCHWYWSRLFGKDLMLLPLVPAFFRFGSCGKFMHSILIYISKNFCCQPNWKLICRWTT